MTELFIIQAVWLVQECIKSCFQRRTKVETALGDATRNINYESTPINVCFDSHNRLDSLGFAAYNLQNFLGIVKNNWNLETKREAG